MFHPEDIHIYLKNLLDKQIKGKNGLVDAYTIQKHKPSKNMLFIVLDTGDSLFCQLNHPLWVFRDKKLIELEQAKDIIPLKDSIWVDKSILNKTSSFTPNSNTVNLVEFLIDNKSKKFFLLKMFLDIKDHIHIRFEPNFINYNLDWCVDLINELYKQTEGVFYTQSVLLCQQIKILCDKIRIPSELGTEIRIVDDTSRLFFTLKFDVDKCINLLETGYSLVKSVAEIPLEIYSEDVYDISTKSKEFMINNVQTHNSFHLGGSATLDRFDIKGEIMSNLDESYRSTIDIIFQQYEDSLIFNSDYCTLTIDKGFFEKFDEKLKKNNEFIILPVGYMFFKYNDLVLPIAIEQETMVYITEERQVSTNIIEFAYTKGQNILKVIPKQIQPEKIAQSLDGLVGGKSPWLSPEGLFMKFYKILGPLGSFDSVYLETIMSNILRNKKEPQYPARLKVPYDPATFSIKSLPSLNSYVLGICFENLSKSLTFGLLSERTVPSEIEKVMFGDPLSQLSIDILKQNRKR